LDNHFYGGVYNLRYNGKKANVILGGGYNEYVGDHFGEIIWAEYSSGSKIRDKFYANSGKKTDFNSYLKSEINLSKKVNSFIDLQVRSISYLNNGKDFGNDIGTRQIDVDTSFTFFNPKLGLTYQIKDNLSSYASFSVANREPVRNDFIDNDKENQPSHETLFDYEAGAELRLKNILGQVNLYYMDYTNQLVNTGALSDVGSNLRTNVENSYRAGIEFVGYFKINKKLNWTINTTLSQNKIALYTEDISGIQIEHKNTDISLSPSIITGSLISYQPIKGLELGLQTKYVGKQYLDNTQSDDRDLPEYIVSDFIASYSTSLLSLKTVQFNLLVNNIFNSEYISNGYTWGFIYGERVSENWLYPQAGTNLLAGVTVKF
jgi:iron complex outermembrane receptor protein